jgi:hypothetical protein
MVKLVPEKLEPVTSLVPKWGKAQRGKCLCAFHSNLIRTIYNEVVQKFNKKERVGNFFS